MRAIVIDPVEKTIAYRGIQYPAISNKGVRGIDENNQLIYEYVGEGHYVLGEVLYNGVGYIVGVDGCGEYKTPTLTISEAEELVNWVVRSGSSIR